MGLLAVLYLIRGIFAGLIMIVSTSEVSHVVMLAFDMSNERISKVVVLYAEWALEDL